LRKRVTNSSIKIRSISNFIERKGKNRLSSSNKNLICADLDAGNFKKMENSLEKNFELS